MRYILHSLTLLTAIALFAACGGGSEDQNRAGTPGNGNSQDAGQGHDDHAEGEQGQENDDVDEDDDQQPSRINPWKGVNHAVCVLVPTADSTVSGVVRFSRSGKGVKIVADIKGLTAGGTNAFHIHEFGNITADDGTSAGSHYNPDGHDHGLRDAAAEARHAGDLGNLVADENGAVHLEITVAGITIAGRTNPIIGRGLIIHAMPDDGGQPTGNAGGRIAMGVIGVAKRFEE